ncbi:MAG: hypothetical protein N2691_04625 [Patescibacteria group bacterium]|nr:hypothetical protein [Patescibacteria group bacterium]
MASYETCTAPPRTTAAELCAYGISSIQESERLRSLSPDEAIAELEQQVGSYSLEVVADQPVSNRYGYWYCENRIYTHPSCKPQYDIDTESFFHPHERGDLPRYSTLTSLRIARENPGTVVLLYSPPGPAALDDNPDNVFRDIQYEDGQLYVMYFDGTQTHAVAVKVMGANGIRHFFPPEFVDQVEAIPDIRERIATYLNHPILTGLQIDDFLSRDYGNETVYIGKDGTEHRLAQVMRDLKSTFAGARSPEYQLDESTRRAIREGRINKNIIRDAYLGAVRTYMDRYGLQRLSLAGSCGGAEITRQKLDGLVLDDSLNLGGGFGLPGWYAGPFSSVGRALSDRSSRERRQEMCCPFCSKKAGHRIKVKAIIKNGTISCPRCKASAPYRC